jgi:hypothetical protein
MYLHGPLSCTLKTREILVVSIEDDFEVQDFEQPYNICKFPPNLSLELTKVVIYFTQFFFFSFTKHFLNFSFSFPKENFIL